MEDLEEKKRKKKAWITSISIQVFMLLLFYFLAAWRAPDPPNPEFGIELNFGQVQTGSGNETVTSPVPEETDEIEQAAPETAEETPLESEDTAEPVDPVETFENQEPDVTQEETTSSSSAQTEQPVETEMPAEETSQPDATKTAEESNPSQGETGESGDQGDPEGDINEEALYGNPGGGDNGSSLQMSGWEWDSPPEPKDTSDETGKIVFEITVDADGYIIGKKVLTTTVSPKVVKQYELAIEQLTFSKTSSYKPAPSSKGVITFIIRSN